MKSRLGLAAAIALLVAAPLFAGSGAIAPGTDLWHTPGDGSTFVDFGRNPLPADFFCPGSQPFSARVELQGAPLAVEGARIGNADTVVERLDTARFGADGVATTRVRLTALSLEGRSPVKTSCGLYTVRASLSGEQPVTQMKIHRDHPFGGHFFTALAVSAKIVFTPLDPSRGEPRQIEQVYRSITTLHPWANRPGNKAVEVRGNFQADTDGDGLPDRSVAGSSTGFAPGWTSFIDAKTGARTVGVLDPNAAVSFVAEDGENHAVTPPIDDEG